MVVLLIFVILILLHIIDGAYLEKREQVTLFCAIFSRHFTLGYLFSQNNITNYFGFFLQFWLDKDIKVKDMAKNNGVF